MKLLSISAKGLQLFKDELFLTFYAGQRVSDADRTFGETAALFVEPGRCGGDCSADIRQTEGEPVKPEEKPDFQGRPPFGNMDGIDERKTGEQPDQAGREIGVHQMGMDEVRRFRADDAEQTANAEETGKGKIQKIRTDAELFQLIDNGADAGRRFFLQGYDNCPMSGLEERTDHFQNDFFSAAGKQSGNDEQHLHERRRNQNLLLGTARSIRLMFSMPKDFFRSSRALV